MPVSRPLSDNLSTLSSNSVDDGNGEPTRPETVPSARPTQRARRPLTRTESVYHKCNRSCYRRGSCTLKVYRNYNVEKQYLSLFPLGRISDGASPVSLVSTNSVSISSGLSMPSSPALAGNSPSDKPSSQERSPKRSFESLEPINSISQVNRPLPKLQKREAAPLDSKRLTVSDQVPAFSQSAPLKGKKLDLHLQKPPKLFIPKITLNTAAFCQIIARKERLSLPSVSSDNKFGPRSAISRPPRRSLPTTANIF